MASSPDRILIPGRIPLPDRGQILASGFVSRTPENPKQQELYNQLPPNQLHRAIYKG